MKRAPIRWPGLSLTSRQDSLIYSNSVRARRSRSRSRRSLADYAPRSGDRLALPVLIIIRNQPTGRITVVRMVEPQSSEVKLASLVQDAKKEALLRGSDRVELLHLAATIMRLTASDSQPLFADWRSYIDEKLSSARRSGR